MKNNPFFSIWIHPRKTIAPLLENHPTRHVLLLAAIFGSVGVLVEALNPKYAEFGIEPTLLILFVAIILGAGLGILGLYLTGWLYSLVGGWLGGKSDALHMRCAIIWSSIPQFISNLVLLLMVLVTSRLALAPELWQALPPTDLLIIGLSYLLVMVLVIWSIVLLCHTMGEAHGYSAWMSLLTIVLSALLLIVAIIVIALVLIIPVMLVGSAFA